MSPHAKKVWWWYCPKCQRKVLPIESTLAASSYPLSMSPEEIGAEENRKAEVRETGRGPVITCDRGHRVSAVAF